MTFLYVTTHDSFNLYVIGQLTIYSHMTTIVLLKILIFKAKIKLTSNIVD